jgi:hypothetical protein
MQPTFSPRRAVSILDQTQGIVGGYVFIWGSPNGENGVGRDSYDTWFDRARPPDYSAAGTLIGYPICMEHGMNEQYDKTAIGWITRTWLDDTGLAFEAQLDKAHPLYSRTLEQVQRGLFSTSSSSAEHMATFTDDGAFRTWMATEVSFTENPSQAEMPVVSLLRAEDGREAGQALSTEYSMETRNMNPIDMGATPTTPAAPDLQTELSDLVAMYGADAVQAALDALASSPAAPETSPPAAPATASAIPVQRSSSEQLRAMLEQQKRNAPDPIMLAMRAEIDALKQAQIAANNAPPPAEPRTVRAAPLSVSEDLKYAHLSASQMALMVKLASAGAPAFYRNQLTLKDMVKNGVFSESFVRTMANKVNQAIEAAQPRKGPKGALDPISAQDHGAMRAARPFRADELVQTDLTSHGLEWVEVFYDTTLWERARDRTELFNTLVAKGMEVITIPQGAKGMNVKLNTASGTVYTMNETSSVDSTGRPEVAARLSQWSTGEVEENASAHVLAHGITFTMEEDSLINIASWLPGEMEQVLAESLESSMINGDKTTTASTNINLIDGTPATGLLTPDYIAFYGLRYNPLVGNTSYKRDVAAALAITDYEATILKFSSPISTRRDNMLFIVGQTTESATRKLPELLTFGVAGNQATIYSGSLPTLFGVDIYMSGYLGLSDATGKISVTPGNNTKGQILCVYAPYWKYGRKRAVAIEQDRSALEQTTVFVATVRHAFKDRGAGAAAISYDITV